jgi:hypothetical protein
MIRLRIAAMLAGIVLASALSAPLWADSVLSASSVSTVSAGSSFDVDVNITGAADLFDYQFDLAFDPAVVQATTISEGAFLSSGGATVFIPGTIDNTGGNITFNAGTLLTAISGVSGSGILVTFDFAAVASGVSNFTIPNNDDLILQDSLGNILNTSTTGTSITVQGSTPVPEPASAFLVLAGIWAVCLLAKRLSL